MLRWLTDENFKGPLIRFLRERLPGLDLQRVQEVGLRTRPDAAILEWAAAEDRLVLSHDYETMPAEAALRVDQGLPMPRLVIVPEGLAFDAVLADLELLDECGRPGEWASQVIYLPQR